MLVAWLVPGAGGRAAAQEGQEPVTELRFEGNHHFPDRVLETAIVTRATTCRSPFLSPFCWAGFGFAVDPSYFNDREFRRDQARIRLFYYERGYREAVVDTVVRRPPGEGVRITFRIQEGEPILVTDVGFTSLEEMPDSSILENLPIREGRPLSLPALNDTRDTLEARLQNRGFAHGEVMLGYDISATTPHEAAVSFDLYPGPETYFGPITVEGESEVKETVVRRMLPFQEGDLYRQDLRFAGLRNLFNLEIFTYAEIIPDLAHVPDSIVPLLVNVQEGDVHRVRVGSGLSTAECINAEAQWTSRDFYGGARQLQLTGRVSNWLAPSLHDTPFCRDSGTGLYGGLNRLLSADFTQPWLFSPRNSLTGGLFWERQSVPRAFIRNTLGASLGLSRTLGSTTAMTLSFRPQYSKVEAVEIFFCSNYLICNPGDISTLQHSNWLSPLGLRVSRDRRNQVLNPTRGYSALLDMEYAAGWTGSQFPYSRFLADGTWYAQGDAGWVLATHLRGGVVVPGRFGGIAASTASDRIVHPDKRFYAGGSNSVRGFPQNELGPRVLHVKNVGALLAPRIGPSGNALPPLCTQETISDRTCDVGELGADYLEVLPTGGTSLLEGSVEVRFPLAARLWEGAAFLDMGQVWGENDEVKLGDLQLTPGFGIRYFSPIGPIRVDLAYRFNRRESLNVVTAEVRPFDPATDDPGLMIKPPVGPPLPYVRTDSLALLGPQYRWGEASLWSLGRLQLNLSIGQAF